MTELATQGLRIIDGCWRLDGCPLRTHGRRELALMTGFQCYYCGLPTYRRWTSGITDKSVFVRLLCEHNGVVHLSYMLGRATALAVDRAEPRPFLACCHEAGPIPQPPAPAAAAAWWGLHITSMVRRQGFDNDYTVSARRAIDFADVMRACAAPPYAPRSSYPSLRAAVQANRRGATSSYFFVPALW